MASRKRNSPSTSIPQKKKEFKRNQEPGGENDTRGGPQKLFPFQKNPSTIAEGTQEKKTRL